MGSEWTGLPELDYYDNGAIYDYDYDYMRGGGRTDADQDMYYYSAHILKCLHLSLLVLLTSLFLLLKCVSAGQMEEFIHSVSSIIV